MKAPLSTAAACGLAAGLALAAGPAAASSVYPDEIRLHLSLGYTPGCELCHANADADAGTASAPVAQSMQARGLVGEGNLPSLDTALDALAAEHTDSDHDGVSDIDELKAGSNPNAATQGPLRQPTYGCFDATGQPPGAGAALAWLAAVATALGLRRRTS